MLDSQIIGPPDRFVAEFRRFAGPLADRYLDPPARGVPSALDRMHQRRFALWPLSWFNWGAFFLPLNWLLSRRLFVSAGLVSLLYVAAFASLSARWGWVGVFGLHLAVGLLADPLYCRAIHRVIAQADADGLCDAARAEWAGRIAGRSSGGLRMGRILLPGVFLAIACNAILSAFGLPAFRMDVHARPPGATFWLAASVTLLPIGLWISYGFIRVGLGQLQRLFWQGLALGAIATLTAAVFSHATERLFYGFATAQISKAAGIAAMAGTTEELAKLIALVAVLLPARQSRDAAALPLLGLSVGLGFGIAENIHYSLSVEFLVAASFRAMTAIPGHATLGLVMGWVLMVATRRRWPQRFSWMAAWLLPALLHAAYDFPLFLDEFDPSPSNWWVWSHGLLALLAVCVVRQLAAIPWVCARPRLGIAVGLALLALLPISALSIASSRTSLMEWAEILTAAAFPIVLGTELLWQSWRTRDAGNHALLPL